MTHEELLLFGERIRDRQNSIGMTQESVAEQVNKRKYCSYTQPPVGIANETMLPDWKSMVLFFSIRDSISISIEIKIRYIILSRTYIPQLK